MVTLVMDDNKTKYEIKRKRTCIHAYGLVPGLLEADSRENNTFRGLFHLLTVSEICKPWSFVHIRLLRSFKTTFPVKRSLIISLLKC